MRIWFAGVLLMAVAACEPSPPPAKAGVGFGNYDQYLSERARQEAQRGGVIAPGPVVSPESTAAVPDGSAVASTAQPTPEPLQVEEPAAPATTEVAAATPVDPDNPAISDEQSFEAVTARESIESDRERLKRQREQYKVIEPTALPKRRGSARPNIVQYALATTNAVGQPVWSRGPFDTTSASERNCARYVSDDLAQEAFLAAGGPQRDPKRLDPDGDGFACGWDPAPFRKIRTN